jgi:hypothetical protein
MTLVAAATPQLKKRARRDWSREKAARFLEVLAETCNVSEACRRSGVAMTVAQPLDGISAYMKSAGTWANYRSGGWEIGIVRGATLILDGIQVVGPQLAAISAPTGGTNVDAEARLSISQILAALREHGLIET